MQLFLFFFIFCLAATEFLSASNVVNLNIDLSSYDDKIRVNTVFGTGRIVTTDSPGKLIIQLIVSKIFFCIFD